MPNSAILVIQKKEKKQDRDKNQKKSFVFRAFIEKNLGQKL